MLTHRRAFLIGLSAGIVAPAIVPYANPMPVKVMEKRRRVIIPMFGLVAGEYATVFNGNDFPVEVQNENGFLTVPARTVGALVCTGPSIILHNTCGWLPKDGAFGEYGPRVHSGLGIIRPTGALRFNTGEFRPVPERFVEPVVFQEFS